MELGLRFALREAPIAARQTLHIMRQNGDKTLEAYNQRVLTIAIDEFKAFNSNMVQQLATEAFLRGCKHKEAAALVLSEAPETIQKASKKVKTVLANPKAIFGTRVTFQETDFTLQEGKRVSDIERKVDSLTDIFRRSSPSPYRDDRTRPRYSPLLIEIPGIPDSSAKGKVLLCMTGAGLLGIPEVAI